MCALFVGKAVIGMFRMFRRTGGFTGRREYMQGVVDVDTAGLTVGWKEGAVMCFGEVRAAICFGEEGPDGDRS